ncbi:hypothetical protein [Kitasatospora sp. NPDC088783]|uniref:hypothetical protein n=1 Tax=Kitasatospora sp. NPDC088783 TaxID=3364077 RepID=UPI0037FF226B
MTVRNSGPDSADVQTLRAELDELLRARQFAAQRERRLAEAVRAGYEPDHSPAYGRPPRQPDPELVRQLAQVQNLREGLGARCLELSDRLLAAEDRQLAGRLADRPAPVPGIDPGTPAQGSWAHRPDEPAAPPMPPPRSFPTGARFGGDRRSGPAHEPAATSDRPADLTGSADPAAALPAGGPPLRGARFGASRPRRAGRKNDDRTTTAASRPIIDAADAVSRSGGTDARPEGPTGTSWAGTGTHDNGTDSHRADSTARPGTERNGTGPTRPGTAPRSNGTPSNSTGLAGPRNRTEAAAPEGGMRARTGAELVALTQRITDLHRQGAVHESAGLVGQAALMTTPSDLVGLAALLRAEGPAGSSTYLARSVALGSPAHAAATLAELRQGGLVDEAADLFHALWSVSTQTLPALLAALERSGQSADGQTLLWERASAPADELAELSQELRVAGRSEDIRHLLRQAAGRPIKEVATIAAALDEESAVELIGELVRLRSASDVGHFAAAIQGSVELYDTLLFAADGLEESRARSVFAALRTAGLPTEPAPRSRPKSRQRR